MSEPLIHYSDSFFDRQPLVQYPPDEAHLFFERNRFVTLGMASVVQNNHLYSGLCRWTLCTEESVND